MIPTLEINRKAENLTSLQPRNPLWDFRLSRDSKCKEMKEEMAHQ